MREGQRGMKEEKAIRARRGKGRCVDVSCKDKKYGGKNEEEIC